MIQYPQLVEENIVENVLSLMFPPTISSPQTTMTSVFTYIKRVYVPKFSKESISYSTYSRKDEFWTQVILLGAFCIFVAFLSFHIWTLTYCGQNYRATVCYTLFYSWGAYAVAIGVVGFFAMLLHYAYVNDPLRHEFESADSSSDDESDSDIKTEADASFVHADDLN